MSYDNVSSDTDTNSSASTASLTTRKSRSYRLSKSRTPSDTSNQKSSSMRNLKSAKKPSKSTSKSSKSSKKPSKPSKSTKTSGRSRVKSESSKIRRNREKSESTSRSRSISRKKEKPSKSSERSKSMKRAQPSKYKSKPARSSHLSKMSKTSSRNRSLSKKPLRTCRTCRARSALSARSYKNSSIPKKSRTKSPKRFRSAQNSSSRSRSRSLSKSASTKSTRTSSKRSLLGKGRNVRKTRSLSAKSVRSCPTRSHSSRPSKTSRSRSSLLKRSRSYAKSRCPRKTLSKGRSRSRRSVKAIIPTRRTKSEMSVSKNHAKNRRGRSRASRKVTFAAGTRGSRKPLKVLKTRTRPAHSMENQKSDRGMKQAKRGDSILQIKSEKVLEMKTPFVVYNTTTVNVSPATRQLMIQTAVLICDHDKTYLDETAPAKQILDVSNEENGVILEESRVYVTRADGMILIQRTSIVNDFWEQAEEVKTFHFQPFKFNVVRLNGSGKPSGFLQVHLMHGIRADKGQMSRREAVVVNCGDGSFIHEESESLKSVMRENKVVQKGQETERGFSFSEFTLDRAETISVSREMGFTDEIWRAGKRTEKMEDMKLCCGGNTLPVQESPSTTLQVQLSPDQMQQLAQILVKSISPTPNFLMTTETPSKNPILAKVPSTTTAQWMLDPPM